MRLSTKQIQIVNDLSNGGYIWFAGSNAYLARKDNEGRIKSVLLNLKTFEALRDGKVIKEKDGKWHL